MLTPEVMEQLLENHLKAQNLLTKKKSWCVKYSSLGGRGLHASRDINQGEIILSDSPIILGPRCYSKYLPMCIVCYKSGCPLFSCDNGCGLPICSADCENSINHINSECKHLKSWSVNCGAMWSMDLLQAVVPIRSLSLDDDKKRLVDALECHDCPRHGREIELLKKNISNEIAKSDEEFMRKVCRVFDTNAFETVVNIDGERSISLRGLFPLGALQNHSCTPNTRHYFTAQGLMVTRAAVAIKAGEELTMTYTDLLWDTSLRRRYLLESKHFECNCKRCSDPLELGSQLGAMRCADTDCYDFIYPDKPLNFETSWSCRKCKRKISKRQIGVIRSGIKSIVDSILLEPPRKILNFIETELSILVPPTNHIMMEMKFRIVSYFGRTDGLSWSDLTDQELNVKIKYCNDLLSVLEKLDLGDHQKKGLILYELYCTRKEKLARRKNKKQLLKEKCETNENKNQDVVDDDDDEETKCDNKIIDKVLEILKDDISAPSDLKNL